MASPRPRPSKTPVAPTPAPKSRLPLIAGTVLVMALIVGGAIAIATHKSASKDSMSMPTSGASSSSAAATATNAVTIQSYAFGPKAITVKAGTTVTWTNTDGVKHTVTSDSGNTLKSDLFGRGETFSYTFMTAGTYSYHCEPHPYMKGTVVVTN